MPCLNLYHLSILFGDLDVNLGVRNCVDEGLEAMGFNNIPGLDESVVVFVYEPQR
jgi:hypothetical protein